MSELQYFSQIVHGLITWLTINWRETMAVASFMISVCATFLVSYFTFRITRRESISRESKEAYDIIVENMKVSYDILYKALKSNFINDCKEWHKAIIIIKDMDGFLMYIKTSSYKKLCVNKYRNFYMQLNCLLNDPRIDLRFFYGKKQGKKVNDSEGLAMKLSSGSEIDVDAPISVDLLQYLRKNMRVLNMMDYNRDVKNIFNDISTIQTQEYKNSCIGFCYQADQYIKRRYQESSRVKEEGVSKEAEVV